ncbi:hypothetical protein [Klebsiella quasipneumoniae]|uniref:hypothetical protein n=1 Tax=Klebsiella quasipneumoniae TaxID=1463165 RepID=UPI001D0D8A23|nr:hypothetical protein [Klebsiella quasipneumoniae]
MSHPEIHVKDWIDVGNSECVVQRLLPRVSSGVCIVVLIKPNQPPGSSAGTAKNGTSCPAVTMEVMQMIMIPVSVN